MKKQTMLCSVAALSLASVAHAQSTDDSGSKLSEVVVTATRVEREGYTAPTPTTVVTSEDLQRDAFPTLGAVLNQLPELRASETPVTSTADPANLGYNIPDLRGLGTSRTLVLVDGQRPVFTSPTGFDLNSIPISLVSRVDVVTGGASAAWGSDAVSGVINVVLDTKLQGVRGSVQYGDPTAGNGGRQYSADFAVGTAFGADDRGHFIFGAQYLDRDQQGPRSSVAALEYDYLSNPNPGPGQPAQILVPNTRLAGLSSGGLIVGTVGGANPLVGTAFGAGGVPYAFQFGSPRVGPFMSGGGPGSVPFGGNGDIAAGTIATQAYSRVSYDLTNKIQIYGSLLYSDTRNSGELENNSTGVSIASGNPFIPAAIQSTMTADHVSAILLSRADNDFDTVNLRLNNTTYWGTVGAEGAFGATWKWDAYYSYGEDKGYQSDGPLPVHDLFLQSVNAVTSPTTGQPVCAVALTNPSTACVPVNLFGNGSVSSAAARYFLATPYVNSTLAQSEFSATLRGDPFNVPAGPVSVATGVEVRRESYVGTADPLSLSHQYLGGNSTGLTGLSGAYSVTEGFLETVVPLIHDRPFFKAFDFNGAVRVSDYSTSGTLTSWKLGLTDDLTDEFRLRATRSQDIRAPNISELYTTQAMSQNSVLDPKTGQTVLATVVTGGNPALSAETAHTTTVGFVYRPAWLPGLEAAVDWYDIDIRNEITTLSAQQEVSDCAAGVTAECAFVSRDAGGNILSVASTYVNVAEGQSSGVDADIAYNLPLDRFGLPGDLQSHLLLSYVDRLKTVTGQVVTEEANLATGLPRWGARLTETYRVERLTLTADANYVGATEAPISSRVATTASPRRRTSTSAPNMLCCR
jgi:outer membrane receptor protein involved in Fe transport